MSSTITPTSIESTTVVTEEKNKKGDPFIWGIYISLILISIIECFSASSREISGAGMDMYRPIMRHCIMLVMGFVLLFLIQRTDYKKFTPWIALFALATLLSMVTVQLIGDYINGAKRSFTLPGIGFSIQPAEMAKLSIVTLIAWFTARNQMVKGVTNRGVTLCAIFVLIYCAFIFLQGLTNTMLLMGISFSMMLIGGVQKRKIAIVILVYALAAGLFFFIKNINDEKKENLRTEITAMNEYGEDTIIIDEKDDKAGRGNTWEQRLRRFFTGPDLIDQEMNGKNSQEMYARIAQAHGGITGVGPGNSRECSRLPLAFSDYIYSIIIEELGLIGGVVVLALFLLLIARAKMIAKKCSRAFPALLIMGMAVMITLQAFFHMGINTGLFPVSGQPLPLISMGGTSILMVSIAFGVMLSVSRYAVQNNKIKEVKAEIRELPEDLRAENPYQSN
ncbi:MAG: FtsW/RodA/SpoVE family cell cycle protein [Muribaculaceae bacterium]|nr:FtsW/RodA/SpoVE family cell cycle protein [Muribaculaceae bacterium]